jgi:hypothetical protein
MGAAMATKDGALSLGQSVATSRHRRRPSPLARGVVYRLGWAVSLSAALWVAVWWALS